MRIKSAYKYQLNELKRPAIIYYSIIVAICIFIVVAEMVWHAGSSVSGLEGATLIFLFVCGLNAFKAPFHMFMANGISRKSMFIGTIAAFATAAVAMALIDSVIWIGMSALTPYHPLIEGRYAVWYGYLGAHKTVLLVIGSFIWQTVAYLAASVAGLFITTAYYRMSKPVKLLVSIGVPALLFIMLPIMDAAVFDGALTRALVDACGWISNLISKLVGAGNPYGTVLINSFWILALAGLTWLLMRRATVKTK